MVCQYGGDKFLRALDHCYEIQTMGDCQRACLPDLRKDYAEEWGRIVGTTFALGFNDLAALGRLIGRCAPAVDIAEKKKEYEVTAELPGLDESNVEVKFADGLLTIKGDKREEKEERKKDYYLSERRFGSFQRSFQVPDGVDADKIEARFKNGVLTVTLPKSPEAQTKEKKIAIKKA